MEDRETARMRKFGESKTTRIMMATVPHVTSGLGLKISGRWIFVDTSVPLPSSHASCAYAVTTLVTNVLKQMTVKQLRFAVCYGM